MKNKFPVRSCCYCKTEVPAGAGSVWKWRGRWYGKHAGCKKGAPAFTPSNVVDGRPRFAPVSVADTDAAAEWEVDAAMAERAGEEAGEATERAFEEANDRAMAGVPRVNF